MIGRVARGEAVELGVEGEAAADLYGAGADACVEAIEWPHGRPSLHLALGVVDPAVAGTDELLGRLDVADRTAQVGAASGDGHIGLWLLALDDLVHIGVEAADVDGRL